MAGRYYHDSAGARTARMNRPSWANDPEGVVIERCFCGLRGMR
jgi:hypothetical protein